MYLEFMNWVTKSSYCRVARLGDQTSRYCRAKGPKVEFNLINLVRHGSSTKFETGLTAPFMVTTWWTFRDFILIQTNDISQDPPYETKI